MTVAATNSRLRRNRLLLVLLIVLFTVSPLTAWLLFGNWQPKGSVAHGELLSPARPLPAWQGYDFDGRPVDANVLRGRWNMVYLSAGGPCNKACETSLYNIRQLKIALGKDMERAQAVLLLTQTADAEFLRLLEQEHDALLKLVLDDNAVPHLMAEAFGDNVVDQGVYLVDPLGNLFMRYSTDVNPSDILKDLRRLLKYSKIG